MTKPATIGACGVLASLCLACRPPPADLTPADLTPAATPARTPAPEPACSGCEQEDGACVAWREDGDEAGRTFARRVACDARCCG